MLTCNKGIMVKFGIGFTKTAVEWKSFENNIGAPKEICQETLLLIDVGAWAQLETTVLHKAGHIPALESMPYSFCPQA